MIRIQYSSVSTPRFTMEYAAFGNGKKPLVIIPGVSLKSVLPSAQAVAAQYDRFVPDHRIYLIDRKKEINAGYSVIEMAEDTAEAMKFLGIENADVFGASQGGMIAQVIAARYPALVGRLLLGSTLACQNETSIRTFTEWIRLADLGNAEALNRAVFTKVYSPSYYKKYEKVFADLEKQGTEEEIRRFGILIRACIRFDFRNEIKKIRCPIQAIGATNDDVLSEHGTAEIGYLTGCHTGIIQGCGHAVYDECPLFMDAMRYFFR